MTQSLLTAGAVHGIDRDRFPQFVVFDDTLDLLPHYSQIENPRILRYVTDFGVAIANFLAAASSLDLVPQESQIFTRIS